MPGRSRDKIGENSSESGASPAPPPPGEEIVNKHK